MKTQDNFCSKVGKKSRTEGGRSVNHLERVKKNPVADRGKRKRNAQDTGPVKGGCECAK